MFRKPLISPNANQSNGRPPPVAAFSASHCLQCGASGITCNDVQPGANSVRPPLQQGCTLRARWGQRLLPSISPNKLSKRLYRISIFILQIPADQEPKASGDFPLGKVFPNTGVTSLIMKFRMQVAGCSRTSAKMLIHTKRPFKKILVGADILYKANHPLFFNESAAFVKRLA